MVTRRSFLSALLAIPAMLRPRKAETQTWLDGPLDFSNPGPARNPPLAWRVSEIDRETRTVTYELVSFRGAIFTPDVPGREEYWALHGT